MSEFQLLNNRTYGVYKDIDMVALSDGSYVSAAAVSQFGSVSSGSAYIAMRRFADDGTPLGDETVIDSKSGDNNSKLFDEVEVAALEGGGFAVVWTGDGPQNIRAQLFENDGSARTAIQNITSPYNITGNKLDVAVNSSTLFIAYDNETTDETINLQSMRLWDGAVSAPITIGGLLAGDIENRYPSLSITADETLRVTYEKVNDYEVVTESASYSRYDYEQDLYSVEIAADGSSVLDQRRILADLPGVVTAQLFVIDPFLSLTSVQITDYTIEHDHTSLSDGRYAVVFRPSAFVDETYLQIFEADGRQSSPRQLVHDMETRDKPEVVDLGGRGIAVLWRANPDGSGDDYDVYGRYFTNAGQALGDAFLVNENIANDQNLTSAEPTLSGGLIVSFESEAYPNPAVINGDDATAALVIDAPNWPAVPATDFDANGHSDILFFNAANRSVGQFQMPSGDWRGIGTAGTGWEARGTGLFDDDDSAVDILWFNVNTRAVGRFDMESGSFAGWSGIGRAGTGWEVKGAGDFNGDGTDDILWFNATSSIAGQFRMSGGDAEWRGIGSTGQGWEITGIADLNGDGRDDILWWNASSGSLGQFRMADSAKSWLSVAQLGNGYEVAETGDFNGDGIDEILVFNAGNRNLGMFDLSGGSAAWVSLGTAGAGWAVSGTGDYDGSGTDDILWRHSDGRIGQYQMAGSDFTWDAIGSAGAAWDVL